MLLLAFAPLAACCCRSLCEQAQAAVAKKAKKVDSDEPVEVADLPAGDDEAESTTIYVKNLAFATTDATLRVSHLSIAGQINMLILDFDTI